MARVSNDSIEHSICYLICDHCFKIHILSLTSLVVSIVLLNPGLVLAFVSSTEKSLVMFSRLRVPLGSLVVVGFSATLATFTPQPPAECKQAVTISDESWLPFTSV